MTLGSTRTKLEPGAVVLSDDAKLYPEVVKLVQSMRGGVSGLVKQFQDMGLEHVASSMTSKGGTRMISPQQIVHGLGTVQMEWLATASGLDVKVVRKELVIVLPMVLEQLTTGVKRTDAVVATT